VSDAPPWLWERNDSIAEVLAGVPIWANPRPGNGSWAPSRPSLRGEGRGEIDGEGKRAVFELASYRRWVTRVMSLSVSDAWVGLGEEMLSGVVLIM
jgi:hypothetical protein